MTKGLCCPGIFTKSLFRPVVFHQRSSLPRNIHQMSSLARNVSPEVFSPRNVSPKVFSAPECFTKGLQCPEILHQRPFLPRNASPEVRKTRNATISLHIRSQSFSLPIFRFHLAVILELDLTAGVHTWALAEQLFRVVSRSQTASGRHPDSARGENQMTDPTDNNAYPLNPTPHHTPQLTSQVSVVTM